MNAVQSAPQTAFLYPSTVHWDELDAIGVLHNSRFAAHIERAVIAWYNASGRRWEREVSLNPDQFHVVREFHIEFLSPVNSPGTMQIEIWVERLGETSCVYGFLCSSEDGSRPYARGTRSVVKLDPASFRPSRWTDFFRDRHRQLLRTAAQ
jgi:acyl-CoA thioester hydrolase